MNTESNDHKENDPNILENENVKENNFSEEEKQNTETEGKIIEIKSHVIENEIKNKNCENTDSLLSEEQKKFLQEKSKELLVKITEKLKKKYGNKKINKIIKIVSFIEIICGALYLVYQEDVELKGKFNFVQLVDLILLILPKLVDACLVIGIIDVATHTELETAINVTTELHQIIRTILNLCFEKNVTCKCCF